MYTLIDRPKIVRVINRAEAEYEALMHGLSSYEWKHIGRPDQLAGIEFQKGMTYYIDESIPYLEIASRLR